MILLGTSGFSYKDWVGPVYPQGLPSSQWLEFAAGLVDTLELNVTYYRIPSTRTVEGWAARTPDGFSFSVKAHQSITHDRKAPEFAGFLDSLRPLLERGKLACVLAQFPHSFHPTHPNRQYLSHLRQAFGELPVVVEFRNSGWVSEQVFSMLRELNLGFCCVDEPRLPGLMPAVVQATAAPGYVRFHGRNAARWWKHDHAWERYDYTYSEEELQEWLPRLQQLDRQLPVTLVYANNHYRGQSLDALEKLRKLLAATEA